MLCYIGMMLSVRYFLFGVLIVGIAAREYKTVDTINGQVRGIRKMTLWKNVPFYSFKGIPYAKPPLNELRFRVRLNDAFDVVSTFWNYRFLLCFYIEIFIFFKMKGFKTDRIVVTKSFGRIWTWKYVHSTGKSDACSISTKWRLFNN